MLQWLYGSQVPWISSLRTPLIFQATAIFSCRGTCVKSRTCCLLVGVYWTTCFYQLIEYINFRIKNQPTFKQISPNVTANTIMLLVLDCVRIYVLLWFGGHDKGVVPREMKVALTVHTWGHEGLVQQAIMFNVNLHKCYDKTWYFLLLYTKENEGKWRYVN